MNTFDPTPVQIPSYYRTEAIEPNTPYPDTQDEMIPPGHYVLGDDWNADTGPSIVIKIEDAYDPDDPHGRDIAPQIAALLARLLTQEAARRNGGDA